MKRMKRVSLGSDQVHVVYWRRYPAHDMTKNKIVPLCTLLPTERKYMTKMPGAKITCPRCLARMKSLGIYEEDVS